MKNDKFYLAFGVLTVAFSRMEADLRMLISGIAFGDKSVVASAFLDASQLSENLRILRKLSRQYWDEENEILIVIKAIESTRETRNLFIHGIWHPGSFGQPGGFATVTDLKTTYEENNAERSWNHSQTLQFSINDFQNILDSVNEVIREIAKVCDLFSSNNEMQFGQGGFTATLKPVIISLSNSISNLDTEKMEPLDDER
jgi:hypothetical protein